MGRTTAFEGVLGTVGRWLRNAFYVGRYLPYSAYYRLADANYRYRVCATRKRVRHDSFRSYEPLHIHGDDWLLAALLDRCRDGDCVVDVGANTGVYALSIAAEYPDSTVVAIEPNPTTAEKLRANVAASGFAERIRVLPIGLGTRQTTAPFHRSNYHELSSFNRYNAERWEARVIDTEEVPVSTLDALVAGGTVPPPDHLKVDAEGFGHEVLRGASETLTTHRPFVYIEPHATGDDGRESAAAIHDLLSTHDYAIIPGEDAWVCVPEGEP